MMAKAAAFPKFRNESDEADWWASAAGRAYVKQRSTEAGPKRAQPKGSPALARLVKAEKTTQIALRLPDSDLAAARHLAQRKGIGYQTLIKMILHEALAKELR